MFTGIVEEVGQVTEIDAGERSATITVRTGHVHEGAKLGDSVAVNGCCLTVVRIDGDRLTFDAVPETLARTNLGSICPGGRVNLERPLAVGDRLGGHFVSGHIDGVGTIVAVEPEENAVVLEIRVPEELRRYVVFKGSIAVDGVSLTVAEVRPTTFTVWTIPHTCAVTTLGSVNVGDRVNVECDLLGKYIERLLLERGADTPPRL
jgi:riboflavin synthase